VRSHRLCACSLDLSVIIVASLVKVKHVDTFGTGKFLELGIDIEASLMVDNRSYWQATVLLVLTISCKCALIGTVYLRQVKLHRFQVTCVKGLLDNQRCQIGRRWFFTAMLTTTLVSRSRCPFVIVLFYIDHFCLVVPYVLYWDPSWCLFKYELLVSLENFV